MLPKVNISKHYQQIFDWGGGGGGKGKLSAYLLQNFFKIDSDKCFLIAKGF